MKISFVIPCYKSGLTIGPVVDEILATVALRPETVPEIILVNDSSPDDLASTLRHLLDTRPSCVVVELARNFNRPGAVMAGFAHVSGDVVVIMDDDGQCPMPCLWDLLAPLEGGADVAIAKYPERKQSAFKDCATWLNRKMTELALGRPPDLEFTNFMAMKRSIADEIARYENPYPYFTGLLLRTTRHIRNVPMEERERQAGTTTFTFRKMVALWVNGLTAFSILPLRFASFCGLASAACGFAYGIFAVVRKLLGADIQAGYSSTIALILFLGGMVLFSLGVIGEYVGRIYMCINRSPQYVVRSVTKSGVAAP